MWPSGLGRWTLVLQGINNVSSIPVEGEQKRNNVEIHKLFICIRVNSIILPNFIPVQNNGTVNLTNKT